MDKAYADTVRLLLTAAPDVFANDIFAMKGGTAINLFVQDMPRLSVDIDVVYTPWQTPREQALKAISDELDVIAGRLVRLDLTTRKVNSRDLGDTKLLIENAESQVKVEVNVVFRGTVLPIERHPLSPKTADLFSVALELPVLAPAELYGSKLVAAMDRQHPRDLFDVLKMFESGGLSDAAVECFVTYLGAGDGACKRRGRSPQEQLHRGEPSCGEGAGWRPGIPFVRILFLCLFTHWQTSGKRAASVDSSMRAFSRRASEERGIGQFNCVDPGLKRASLRSFFSLASASAGLNTGHLNANARQPISAAPCIRQAPRPKASRWGLVASSTSHRQVQQD